MSWIHAATARLRLIFARRSFESRMDSELRFHIEMETERLVRELSLAPDEARRRALVAFGGMENHREELRDGRGTAWLGALSLDFKLGLRMLVKRPGLTFVSVLGMSVAVVIGALAFTTVRAVIDSDLPVSEGNRVVTIQNFDARTSKDVGGTHLHDLADWRQALSAVDELGAYRISDRNLVPTDAPPGAVHMAEMTASAFRIARVTPQLGRYLSAEDEQVGAPSVAVISYEVWQRRLAARTNVIGSTVQLGTVPHTVIGVMPKGFAFPFNEQLWIPLRLNALAFERGEAPPIRVMGRLAPNASLAEARLQLTTIGQRLAIEYPKSHQHIRPNIFQYTKSFMRDQLWRSLLRLGQVVVILLLIVVATNVAVLVYARTASRSGELAVRTALGASRGRIASQLFVESLVLSSVASGVGIVAAYFITQRVEAMIRQASPNSVPYWMHLSITPSVVAFVVGLTVLAAVIIGAIPGLKATRNHVSENLKEFFGGSSMQLGRTWTALLIAQVAVSVAALPAALSMGGMSALGARLDRGAAAQSFVMATPSLDVEESAPANTAEERSARRVRYNNRVTELAQSLKQEPGDFDVEVISSAPGLEDEYLNIEVSPISTTPGRDTTTLLGASSLPTGRVGTEFFNAFGIRVLAGRNFTAPDFGPAAPAAIVNRTFVDRFLGGGNALGRRFSQVSERTPTGSAAESGAKQSWEIVGVVENYPASVVRGSASRIYLPLRPLPTYPLTLAVRANGLTPQAAANRVRTVAKAVDPILRFAEIRTLDDLLNSQEEGERLAMIGLLMLSMSVVFLSAAGIYALMSFTVARRQREIAIRIALGARSVRVIVEILSRSMRQIGIGIVLGVVGFGMLGPLLGESSPWREQLIMLAKMGAAMAMVGVIATIGPARRALSVQPTEALRSE